MIKPSVFACFDAEDPANPETDEPIRRIGDIFANAGLQACFVDAEPHSTNGPPGFLAGAAAIVELPAGKAGPRVIA